jgi:DNA-binding XRE family transcriptional regulator
MGFSEVAVTPPALSAAPTTFRARLIALRNECGATQQDLANHLGVPVETVQAWEEGAVRPDSPALAAIATAFDTTVDYLILATKQRMPPSWSASAEAS